jgi:translation initiation factor IF-3
MPINELRINEEIRAREIRVIDAGNEQLGIMAFRDALKIAFDKDLDLVEISPTAQPPVCRIMDYGKFRFEQNKREREARKKQRVVELKEIRMTPKIEDHDFDVKAKHTHKFLKEGDKVKVTIRFRGREIVHSDLGRKLLMQLYESVKEFAFIERDPRLEGKNMIMILAAKADQPVKSEKPVQTPPPAKVEQPATAKQPVKVEKSAPALQPVQTEPPVQAEPLVKPEQPVKIVEPVKVEPSTKAVKTVKIEKPAPKEKPSAPKAASKAVKPAKVVKSKPAGQSK